MVAVAILAAGRGTRMKSSLPKVLHSLGGRSLVERVLDSLQTIPHGRRMIIVGYQAQEVITALQAKTTFNSPQVEFIEQTEQLGTGHAIQQVIPRLEGFTGDLLVLNGDVPLLRPETIKQLLQAHNSYRSTAQPSRLRAGIL